MRRKGREAEAIREGLEKKGIEGAIQRKGVKEQSTGKGGGSEEGGAKRAVLMSQHVAGCGFIEVHARCGRVQCANLKWNVSGLGCKIDQGVVEE